MITRHGRPFGPLVQSNLASRADNLRERSRIRQRTLVNSIATADVTPRQARSFQICGSEPSAFGYGANPRAINGRYVLWA
jgi:hypothetical protein